MKVALFFALQAEANSFIEHYNAKQVKAFATIKLYEATHIYIIITGIGELSMAAAVAWFAALYNTHTLCYFNIGTAASATLLIGNCYHINSIHTNKTREHFYPDTIITTNLKSKSLYSSNNAVDGETITSITYDLIDMEGFAFAKTAQKFINSSCIQVVKYCSDNGDIHFYKNKDWLIAYEANVAAICNYITDYASAITNVNNAFERDVSCYINKVKETVHITFSETVQLKQALHYAIIKTTKQKLSEITTVKNNVVAKEKDSFFSNLISQLYHV